jgi:hypothetical protein
MNIRTPAAIAALLATAFAAQADTVSYTSATLPLTSTDWHSFLDLQQFDPALGHLNSVTLVLTADLFGSTALENRSSRAVLMTANLGATLTLARPDGEALVVAAPLVVSQFSASAYDGVKNYAGTSGVTYSEQGQTLSNSASFSDSATLALFTGAGSVHAPLGAVADSQVVGSGNFYSKFTTLAGGHAAVTYDYSPSLSTTLVSSVPEPESWALMLAGVGALASLARRRRVPR